MSAGSLRNLIPIVLIGVAGLAGVIGLQNHLDSLTSSSELEKRLLFIPDHRVLHAGALGDDALAADILWLRSVFYIAANDIEEKQSGVYDDLRMKTTPTLEGERPTSFSETDFSKDHRLRSIFFWNQNSDDLPQLLKLIDTVTDLDPRFVAPYIHGAMNLALNAGSYAEAMRILDKGVINCPDSWEPLYYRGFLKLFYANDKLGSSQDVLAAAEKPGAPIIVVQLAAALTVGAGRRNQALSFLHSLREVTEDEKLRQKIDNMLLVYGQGAATLKDSTDSKVGNELESILRQTTGNETQDDNAH